MDLLNPTFLIFLGIACLLIALLTLYFENKFREQNHKITSMLSLVSTLADEINNSKIGLNNLTMMVGGAPIVNKVFDMNERKADTLINVSDDDDDDDEDEDEEDEDEEEDVDEDEDEDEDEEDVDEDEECDEINHDAVNIRHMLSNLNMGDTNSLGLEECIDLNVDQMNDIDCGTTSCNADDVLNNKSIIYTKTIDLRDLQDEMKSDIVDYKKMTITQLRTIVSDKALSSEPNKLKKNDLIKLLENK